MSELLPPRIRDALVAAAKIPDDFERRRAIATATQTARLVYPELFNFDKE
jgi:hypothetical protein